MNAWKKKFYEFAYSAKNPINRLMGKKEKLSCIFGEKYIVEYEKSSFYVQYEKGKGGIIFNIHGGGYLFGHLLNDNHLCHYLHEKTGMTVVSCHYDLSDRAKFPTQINQVYQTIKTMCEDPSIDTQKIFVIGHSAGGNCATAVTLLTESEDYADYKDFHVDGQILDYPVTDMRIEPRKRPKVKGSTLSNGMMEYFNEMYFTNPKLEAWSILASPVYTPEYQLRKLPPTYILTCAMDCLRDDGIRYYEKMKEAGVRVHYDEADEIHGFIEEGMYDYYGKRNKKGAVAAAELDKIADWILSI